MQKAVSKQTKAEPRLIRALEARRILGGRGIVEDCEKHGWLKAVVRQHRLTLYSAESIHRCADRIIAGEYPKA